MHFIKVLWAKSKDYIWKTSDIILLGRFYNFVVYKYNKLSPIIGTCILLI